MLTPEQAKDFARRWLASFHVDRIEELVAYWAEDGTLESPMAQAMVGAKDNVVRGHTALREYFAKGLAKFPHAHLELIEVMCGANSVIVYYVNQKGTRTGAFVDLDERGKIKRNVVAYSV